MDGRREGRKRYSKAPYTKKRVKFFLWVYSLWNLKWNFISFLFSTPCELFAWHSRQNVSHSKMKAIFVLFSSESLLGSFHQEVFMEVLICIKEDLTLNNHGVNQPLTQKQERRKKRFKNDGPEIADSKGRVSFDTRRKQFKIICKETDMIKFFNNANLLLLFTHWVMSGSLQPHGL